VIGDMQVGSVLRVSGGKVGIGSSNPVKVLVVSGDMEVSGVVSGNGIEVDSMSGGGVSVNNGMMISGPSAPSTLRMKVHTGQVTVNQRFLL
jgi:hypothetical protein